MNVTTQLHTKSIEAADCDKLATCVAVLVHCFNDETWLDLCSAIENINAVVQKCCIVVTVRAENATKYKSWKAGFEQQHQKSHVAIVPCENRGMDIGGFFVACEHLQCSTKDGWPEPKFVFKLHSKSNTTARKKMLHDLCDTPDAAVCTLQKMIDAANVGLMCSNLRTEWWQSIKWNSHLYDLAAMARIKLHAPYKFAAGTMFCMRWSLLQAMFQDLAPPRVLIRLLNDVNTIDINWHRNWRMSQESTDAQVREHCVLQGDGNLFCAKTPGSHERDCMIEHSFERFFGIYVSAKGYQVSPCNDALELQH